MWCHQVTKPNKKPSTETAKRALKEAQLRRKKAEESTGERPKEYSGRKGPDPARYGDWENKGIASDF